MATGRQAIQDSSRQAVQCVLGDLCLSSDPFLSFIFILIIKRGTEDTGMPSEFSNNYQMILIVC